MWASVSSFGGLLARFAASSGASLIGFMASGAGAIKRTIQSRLRDEVSVFDFMTEAEISDVQAETYTLDVQPAVQAAINFSAAANLLLKAPGGGYRLGDSVSVVSNLAMIGVGKKTNFRGVFATAKNRIFTSSDTVQQSNILLQDFAIDRTDANSQHGALFGGVDGFTVRGIYVIGSPAPTVTSGAIGFSPFDTFADIESRNVLVTGCHIEKCNNFGIAFGHVKNGIIKGCTFIDCFREAIGIEGYDSAPGTAPEKGNENITVIGNTLIMTENSNRFGGSDGPAMLIGGSTSEGYVRNVVVAGNTIIGSEVVSGQAYNGIMVNGGATLWTEDVTIIGNTIKNMNGRGIAVGSAGALTKNVIIKGNKIKDVNLGGNASPSGSAIGLRSTSGCIVRGNAVNGTTHTHIVEETSGADSNSIHGNDGDDGTSGRIVLVGANSSASEPKTYQSIGPGVMYLETVTIADESTYTFRARGANNRALYFLSTSFGDTTQGIFSVNGTGAPLDLASGAAVSYGATNPDILGAVNVWPASSTTISIKNRLGSARQFTLASIATQ